MISESSASEDPVAIDQASVDLVNGEEGNRPPNFQGTGNPEKTNFVPSIRRWTGTFNWPMAKRSAWEQEIMN